MGCKPAIRVVVKATAVEEARRAAAPTGPLAAALALCDRRGEAKVAVEMTADASFELFALREKDEIDPLGIDWAELAHACTPDSAAAAWFEIPGPDDEDGVAPIVEVDHLGRVVAVERIPQVQGVRLDGGIGLVPVTVGPVEAWGC